GGARNGSRRPGAGASSPVSRRTVHGALRAARASSVRADPGVRGSPCTRSAPQWRGRTGPGARAGSPELHHGTCARGRRGARGNARLLARIGPGGVADMAGGGAGGGGILLILPRFERRTRLRRRIGRRRKRVRDGADARDRRAAPMYLEFLAQVVDVVLDGRS